MTYPICPCDGDFLAAPVNSPGLSHISYRVGRYADFRQAVLTPLFIPATPQPLPVEQTLSVNGLPVWRTNGPGDLAVMVAEWFAYIADIITFYNERIANQDYLRTADLPESVTNLIALLGYRPRPAIGACGALAALLNPGPSFGQSAQLPRGLQFQSKPAPGQAPQTFELSADTTIAAPDQLSAAPAPVLLAAQGSGQFGLLLQGPVKSIEPGALLVLRSRMPSAGGPWLAPVIATRIGPAPAGGGQQTNLTLSLCGSVPTALAAAQASLDSSNQSAAVWSIYGGGISMDGTTVHLANVARQILPGQWVLFTAGGSSPPAPVLAQVASTTDFIWDATGAAGTPTKPSDPLHPVPVLHTILTLSAATALTNTWEGAAASGVNVAFDWFSVGTLLDQPPGSWSGSPLGLLGTGAQPFPSWSEQPILLQDASGVGITATAGSSGASFNLELGTLTEDPVPLLQPPFLVLPNVLPVTEGKTVANEVLGNGDATNPAQDFQLSQSPVTYLQQGVTYASTIQLSVNNLPWREVSSFYGQSPTATVFVTREDGDGNTHVMFGDGVNGARLPAGVDNVIATYRVGAGAASPPVGKLTVIPKSFPGLRAVLNPVAVGGGSDPDPPDQIRRYASRSVLTFGRAVSVFDYQALAAQAPGVTRASAVWAWDDARQRALVKVYVGDNPAAATSARTSLAAAGDPNRPVSVVQATQISVSLIITLIVTPGMDNSVIASAVQSALTDDETGLFGSWRMGIGQTVFDSQIETSVLGAAGAVAITVLQLLAGGTPIPGPLYNPGEGGYFTLAATDVSVNMEPDPNG